MKIKAFGVTNASEKINQAESTEIDFDFLPHKGGNSAMITMVDGTKYMVLIDDLLTAISAAEYYVMRLEGLLKK